jgi:hypothetical protein
LTGDDPTGWIKRGHRPRSGDNEVTSVPEITRLLAKIHDWQDGHGKPGGRADAARRLDEAHKLLDEISNILTEARRELLGAGRRPG